MIRRGASSDVPFMRDMLTHAYYWRWGTPGAEDIPTSRYVDGWGRPGDTSVIALDGGFPVGAAWYRLFTEDAPGFGFVDDRTPELTIAVVPSKRGKGLGEQLMSALLERARQAGHDRISLSVEQANPARKLYERFGFGEVDERGDTVVMVAELDGVR
jgi:ribosomal protein S18 acetylase RimI-like enzyme